MCLSYNATELSPFWCDKYPQTALVDCPYHVCVVCNVVFAGDVADLTMKQSWYKIAEENGITTTSRPSYAFGQLVSTSIWKQIYMLIVIHTTTLLRTHMTDCGVDLTVTFAEVPMSCVMAIHRV